jgi:hypothetical protein
MAGFEHLGQEIIRVILSYVIKTGQFKYCGQSIWSPDVRAVANLRLTSKQLKQCVDSLVMPPPPWALRSFDWGRLKQTAQQILAHYPPSQWIFCTVGTTFPLTVFMALLDEQVDCLHLLTGKDHEQDHGVTGALSPFRPPTNEAVKTVLESQRKIVIIDWSGIDFFLAKRFLSERRCNTEKLVRLCLDNDYPDLWPVGTADVGTIAWLVTRFHAAKDPIVTLAPLAIDDVPKSVSLRQRGRGKQDPAPKFGTEMTFTNAALVRDKKNPLPIEERKQWIEQLRAMCSKFKTHEGSLLFEVDDDTSDLLNPGEQHPRILFPKILMGTSAEDWWYQVTTDCKVIELKTKPMTLVELLKLEKILVENDRHLELIDLIQRFIFDAAKEKVGLEPHDTVGAGHIHIDIESAFMSNPIMLLNFMTDIHNLGAWPFLAMGHQYSESAPLSLLPQDSIEAYAQIVATIGKSGMGESTCDTLLQLIRDTVYIHSRNHLLENEKDPNKRDLPSIQKYQTVSLTKVSKVTRRSLTLELRALRPQHSATELRRMIELLHNRIVYATEREQVVRFDPPQANRRSESGTKPESYVEIARRFIQYALAAKVNPLDYLEYMAPEFQNGFQTLLAEANGVKRTKGPTPPKNRADLKKQ